MFRNGLKLAAFSALLAFFVLDKTYGKAISETIDEDVLEKIVGGRFANIRKHPYQVLVTDSSFVCGGSIISESHILTAAHCVDNSKKVYVISGYSTLHSAMYLDVNKIHMHPEYDSGLVKHDIAVLKLAKPLVFTARRQKINLPTKNVTDGEVATITGFGALSADSSEPSTTLQVLQVKIWSHESCKILYGSRVTDNQICILNREGIGACVGDSGGPLAINNTVVGIVSWGIGSCANGLPQVFTNVYKYLPFINDAMKLS